jgi:hypothetical protein
MNINQSIETRYVGPTNHRGSRIIATTPGGHKLTHAWNYEFNIEANHYAAAEALRAKLDWPSIKAGGSTAKGYAFVTTVLGA